MLPKLSCVMTTYRRFTCVERSISMFLNQDYEGESELIILNTDVEHPLILGDSLKSKPIVVYNNNIDFKTGKPYNNVGAIRRDAASYATGSYYICWDDDDIFMPWNNRQGIEGVLRLGHKAFKPVVSFFATGDRVELARNTMEASITVDINEVKDSFDLSSGKEHLGWYTKLRDQGQLNENNTDSVPAYCFNWSDPREAGGHKQSGSIDRLDNFEYHKEQCTDFAKRPVEVVELSETYKKYYNYFRNNKDQFNVEYFDKYVIKYL